MIKFNLFSENRSPKVLCLGAHSDDIEIGCGGTILRLVKEAPKAHFYWQVLSGNKDRAQEARESATSFLSPIKKRTVDVQNFRESYFPFIGAEIKDHFEKIKNNFAPDIILTHSVNDAHQDHQLVSKLTWNTFRDNFILEYEIPKYDGDLVTPNLYTHINASDVEKKLDLISNLFQTQKEKPWFSKETFRSIMKIRGIECNSPSGYAEAFHCRKIIL